MGRRKYDPASVIWYKLQTLLACYQDFEDRVGLMNQAGKGSTAYDVVRAYVDNHIGRFTGADAVAHCPSIGRSSVLSV